jgi:hypothetical protein
MKIKSPYTGREYEWRRVPRSVHWRHKRIQQTYYNLFSEIAGGDTPEGETPEEKEARQNRQGLALLESMTPEEARRFELYVNDVLSAGLGGRVDVTDQAQLPEPDYWYLFGLSAHSNPEAMVETEEGGELTAGQLGEFPPDAGLPPAVADVPDVRREAVEVIAAG